MFLRHDCNYLLSIGYKWKWCFSSSQDSSFKLHTGFAGLFYSLSCPISHKYLIAMVSLCLFIYLFTCQNSLNFENSFTFSSVLTYFDRLPWNLSDAFKYQYLSTRFVSRISWMMCLFKVLSRDLKMWEWLAFTSLQRATVTRPGLCRADSAMRGPMWQLGWSQASVGAKPTWRASAATTADRDTSDWDRGLTAACVSLLKWIAPPLELIIPRIFKLDQLAWRFFKRN